MALRATLHPSGHVEPALAFGGWLHLGGGGGGEQASWFGSLRLITFFGRGRGGGKGFEWFEWFEWLERSPLFWGTTGVGGNFRA